MTISVGVNTTEDNDPDKHMCGNLGCPNVTRDAYCAECGGHEFDGGLTGSFCYFYLGGDPSADSSFCGMDHLHKQVRH